MEKTYTKPRRGRPIQPRPPIDRAGLRAARIAADISARELAEWLSAKLRVHVASSTLAGWELDQSRPPAAAVDALERRFRIQLVERPASAKGRRKGR